METVTVARELGQEEIAELLVRSKRTGAAERVLEHVSEATRVVMTQCLREGDFDDYRAFEAERMGLLAEKTRDLLQDTVLPFCLDYVRSRFPKIRRTDFPRFGDLKILPGYFPSTDEEIISGFPWRIHDLLGSCEIECREGWPVVRIGVNLDALFQNLPSDNPDGSEFEDALIQVIAHETMHAISSNFYLLNREEREGEIQRLTFLETLGFADTCPSWRSLSTRVGYSCNFVASRLQKEETPFQTLPVVNAINEGLTDTFAARAYSAYRKNAGLPPKKYRFSYSDEARAFTYAMRSFAAENGADPNEVFRSVEAGYFLGDDEFLTAFDEIVLPSMEKFTEAMGFRQSENAEEDGTMVLVP